MMVFFRLFNSIRIKNIGTLTLNISLIKNVSQADRQTFKNSCANGTYIISMFQDNKESLNVMCDDIGGAEPQDNEDEYGDEGTGVHDVNGDFESFTMNFNFEDERFAFLGTQTNFEGYEEFFTGFHGIPNYKINLFTNCAGETNMQDDFATFNQKIEINTTWKSQFWNLVSFDGKNLILQSSFFLNQNLDVCPGLEDVAAKGHFKVKVADNGKTFAFIVGEGRRRRMLI